LICFEGNVQNLMMLAEGRSCCWIQKEDGDVLGCSPSRGPSPLRSITYVEAVELQLGRMAVMFFFVPFPDVVKGSKISCVQVSLGGMIK
jgi:hypothetical protein